MNSLTEQEADLCALLAQSALATALRLIVNGRHCHCDDVYDTVMGYMCDSFQVWPEDVFQNYNGRFTKYDRTRSWEESESDVDVGQPEPLLPRLACLPTEEI